MSKLSEDKALQEPYPYAWSKESELTLTDFLAKFKPSMVQDDGMKPWIWVHGPSVPEQETQEIMEAATAEATEILNDVTEKVEAIKNDASIPTRSNKKTGAKSKKELREQAQAEASEKLKEISIRHGFVSGKWLIFAPSDKVDMVWSSLATSLATGALSSTCAYRAKVATCPKNETPNYQHVLCLYMPNVYDKESVTAVMRILLKDHGMNLSGVKSNMYTALGIDSKHPSGIQSTVWKNTALLKDSEIKQLKDAFFSGLAAAKSAAPVTKPDVPAPAPAKSKLKPKKKPGQDDPFASSDDGEASDKDEKPPKRPAAKVTKTAPKTTKPVLKKKQGKRAKDSDEDEESDEDKPKPRRKKAEAGES